MTSSSARTSVSGTSMATQYRTGVMSYLRDCSLNVITGSADPLPQPDPYSWCFMRGEVESLSVLVLAAGRQQ